jgi:hypothetical protein
MEEFVETLPPVPAVVPVVHRKAGRPKNKVIKELAKKDIRKEPGAIQKVREITARILATKGDLVMQTVLRKALDDNDKDQVVCLKMCVDRLLPMSYIEGQVKRSGNAVTINIVGVGETQIVGSSDEDGSQDAEDINFEMESPNG